MAVVAVQVEPYQAVGPQRQVPHRARAGLFGHEGGGIDRQAFVVRGVGVGPIQVELLAASPVAQSQDVGGIASENEITGYAEKHP